ncbi:MAG TPA: glycoside hydrolase family 2 protein [Polyangiaceae bacterium]|nr:glycoside hydrolase family 2 protein [Polyangiaceae bacterium]
MAQIRSATSYRTQPLEEGWEVASTDPDSIVTPAELGRAWTFWPATVPGTAAGALRAAGAWDFERPQDFDARDWWYRTRFAAHAAGAGDTALTLLRLEGLATVADVWLNGLKILEADNMFRAHELDVGASLRDTNELAIRFRSLAALVKARRGRPRWRTKLVDSQQLRWFRTTLLGRIPGWTPPVAAVGPWRPVVLEERKFVSIERASVRATRQGDGGRVVVAFSVRALGKGTLEAAHLCVGDQRQALTCTRGADGMWTVGGELRISRVELWWPHTHGAQPLYPVSLVIRVNGNDIACDCGKVGFRSIELVSEGGAFEVRVNDVPVFCRGACWTTTDVVTLDGKGAGAAAALDTARRAGMNMLRVGGTMVYESDAFYDVCDERGIMVWQDFMFANMDYPADDEAFRANVTAEAGQVMRQLETRPSLAIVCGNSEVEQQVAMLGLARDLWKPQLFYETLPEVARALGPDVPYVPSTPTGGALPFDVDTGLSHYYGVGAYLRPLEDARRAGVRFTSECLGFSNVPEDATVELVLGAGQSPFHHPRWKARVPRDSGPGWDFEDVRDHYVALLFGIDPAKVRYADMARYLALGRVTTGEIMAAMLAEWRRPGSRCRGALIWFFRDLWPGAGWGVVDANGLPKAAYYYVKRASKSVAVFVTDEGLNGLDLHVVNESSRALSCEVRLALYRDGEAVVAVGTKVERVLPRAGLTLRADALLPGFFDVTYAYRFGPPAHDVTVVTLVDAETQVVLDQAFHFPRGLGSLPACELGLEGALREVDEDHYAVTLRTRRFALAVAVAVDGCLADDNYFHLPPGAEKTVTLVRQSGSGRPGGWLHALNGRSPVRLALGESKTAERDR